MNYGRRFLGLSTSDARSIANNLAPAFGAVSAVLNELNSGATPSDDEMSASIAAASQINDAITSLASQDSPGAYLSSTGAVIQELPAVQTLLYNEQTNIAQHAGTGFVAPPDPATLAAATASWNTVQAAVAQITSTANTIDAGISNSSQQASAGAAAQAAAAAAAAGGGSPTGGSPTPTPAAGGSSGGSSTSTSGSTVVTPPVATPPVVTPGSTAPISLSSPAALVAGITPAAWVFISLGGLLVIGLWAGYVDVPKPVASALGIKSRTAGRKKNPRRRARRRRAR